MEFKRMSAQESWKLLAKLNQKTRSKSMEKKKWNKCKCGRIFDPDERCPVCGLINELNPKLELVELDKNEIRALVKRGKVYTKHVADLERWLSQ